eukprot:TRINITY_DN25226_c0_g1_i1.p1 TRINITY_DN25226_c0_g1~~TRINITY_DN25226_c0_g1_i1.p1  ORF type:complete len:194 (+),score=28.72 TRINITY_DN25226_c0_g1_i1:486-1067(+)
MSKSLYNSGDYKGKSLYYYEGPRPTLIDPSSNRNLNEYLTTLQFLNSTQTVQPVAIADNDQSFDDLVVDTLTVTTINVTTLNADGGSIGSSSLTNLEVGAFIIALNSISSIEDIILQPVDGRDVIINSSINFKSKQYDKMIEATEDALIIQGVTSDGTTTDDYIKFNTLEDFMIVSHDIQYSTAIYKVNDIYI